MLSHVVISAEIQAGTASQGFVALDYMYPESIPITVEIRGVIKLQRSGKAGLKNLQMVEVCLR